MIEEDQEQITLAGWLNGTGVPWCHVPNGGKRNRREAAKLRAMGVRRGVPDILIFDIKSVAIELKRARPAKSKVSEHQLKWLAHLDGAGWHTVVCYGAQEAIEYLRGLGYRSTADGDKAII